MTGGAKSFSLESLSTEISKDEHEELKKEMGDKYYNPTLKKKAVNAINKLIQSGLSFKDALVKLFTPAPTTPEAENLIKSEVNKEDKVICGSRDYVAVVRWPSIDFPTFKPTEDNYEDQLAEYKENLNKFSRELKLEKVKLIFQKDTSKLEKVTTSTLLKTVKALKDIVKKKSKIDDNVKALANSESNLSKLSTKVSDTDSVIVKAAVAQFKLRSRLTKEVTVIMNEEITCLFNNIKSAISGIAKLTSYVSEEKEKDDE